MIDFVDIPEEQIPGIVYGPAWALADSSGYWVSLDPGLPRVMGRIDEVLDLTDMTAVIAAVVQAQRVAAVDVAAECFETESGRPPIDWRDVCIAALGEREAQEWFHRVQMARVLGVDQEDGEADR